MRRATRLLEGLMGGWRAVGWRHRSATERDIIQALPALRAMGLFNVLQIRSERLRAFVEAN